MKQSAWIKRDLDAIWHPYTQMKDCQDYPPVLIEKAKGIKLYDAKGKFYYDTISSWWCNVHGHNHPVIKKAIMCQMEKLDHVLFAGFTHRPAIALAEQLCALAPSSKLTRVFYSDNGSTAVEVALKMSLQYWQNIEKKKKTLFVALDRAYHGDTVGAMSVGGVALFQKRFASLLFPVARIPAPYCYRCPMGKKRESCGLACISPLEKLLAQKHTHIAAIILEPLLLAAGGMIVYPSEYLQKVGDLARRYQVHLIIDEVATGFGRTGKMFACEYVHIQPDFLCLSKGITSGYLPLAVTLTTEKIYRGFWAEYDQGKTFYHGHTYTANPIACSAALGSLSLFQKENTLKKIQGPIVCLKHLMHNLHDLPYVGDVRTLGLIAACELVHNKKTKKPFDPKKRIGLKVYKEGLAQGVVLRPLGDVVYVYLPLCITEQEIKLIFKKVYTLLSKIRP